MSIYTTFCNSEELTLNFYFPQPGTVDLSQCLYPVEMFFAGIHTDYLINKLDDENCELKQPIQCEEDSLRSETFQKYTHSDITQQKELFEGVFQSLTDEKVLCVSQVSDTTDPKHYVDSLN